MIDNHLAIVLCVLFVVSLVAGSGLQWRPCPELSTSLRFPCRCKVEPFGPKLQLGAVSMDCDNVVFQTESPILPTGAPIISFSQRYSGQQVLPTQVIYDQSVASILLFWFYSSHSFNKMRLQLISSQATMYVRVLFHTVVSATDFHINHSLLVRAVCTNGIAINSYSRRLMSINWPLVSCCLHQLWNANEVKIKVCEQWARMSHDQFWGEPRSQRASQLNHLHSNVLHKAANWSMESTTTTAGAAAAFSSAEGTGNLWTEAVGCRERHWMHIKAW